MQMELHTGQPGEQADGVGQTSRIATGIGRSGDIRSGPEAPGHPWNRADATTPCGHAFRETPGQRQYSASPTDLGRVNHTMFEGTSQIRQLVIGRAISGMRIE